jgi:hypothetical protein
VRNVRGRLEGMSLPPDIIADGVEWINDMRPKKLSAFATRRPTKAELNRAIGTKAELRKLLRGIPK